MSGLFEVVTVGLHLKHQQLVPRHLQRKCPDLKLKPGDQSRKELAEMERREKEEKARQEVDEVKRRFLFEKEEKEKEEKKKEEQRREENRKKK